MMTIIRCCRGTVATIIAVLALFGASNVQCLAQLDTAQPGDTIEINLVEAIRLGVLRSAQMGIAQADLDFSEARQDFAESSRFLPRFSAESSHAPAPGLSDSPLPPNERYLDPGLRNSWDKFRMFNQLTVSLTQPILTWGQITGSVDAARWGSEVSRAGLREQSLAVARRTSELYFAVLLSSELVRLEEETGLLLERAKNEIGRLLDDGAEGVDDADLFDLLITEQDYKRAVVFADRSYQLAVATLGRQLFVPRGVVVIPAERALNPLDFRLDSMTSYLDDSSLWRPEIEKAIAGVAASESLVRVAKSDYLPKLYLSATARIAATPGRSSQPNPYIRDPLVGRGYIAGIGFTQNLNFARSKAKVRQAEAERDGVLEKQRGVNQVVRFEVEQAYHSVIIARANLDSQKEALRISKEWLKTEEINFDLELGDTENLVKAVQRGLQRRADYATAINRYNVSIVNMLDATGLLLDNQTLAALSYAR